MDELISRNAALALVVKAIHGTDSKEIQDYLFGGLRKELWALPSEQLRPKGKWIVNRYDSRGVCCCGNCFKQFVHVPLDGEGVPWNYCPNCGADMRGGDQ